MAKTEYDIDFYVWTQAQAKALRVKAWDVLDIEHLAAEIEDLGKEQRHALASHLRLLLLHLLEWAYQAERRGESWRHSINNARAEIDGRLAMSPSLRRDLPTFLGWACPRARCAAADETGLARTTFPETCPWSLEQLLNDEFLPERLERGS